MNENYSLENFSRPKLELPVKDSKLLLHSCCAPCAGEIMEAVAASEIDTTVYFYNPNIHPNRKQWANGTWSAASSNASEFLANLRVNTNPVITMKVRITSANNHLMIKFPTKNFNGEEYVFRRYEF